MLSLGGQLTLYHNVAADTAAARYPQAFSDITSLAKARRAFDEISQWPAYRPTPLYRLDHLAADLQVDKIWYKDESQRFHLKSFKALGGAFAVARQLQHQVEQASGHRPTIADLLAKKHADIVANIVISCATDGNHGRSVAWGCQMFGCHCIIYIHREVSAARAQAMQNFGAEVIRISGNYDDSVRQADSDARRHGRIIVSDTSYPGYMEIAKDVALGYSVLLTESVKQMQGEIPTHVLIQGGVGGLAASVCAYFWELWAEQRPRFIIVEPQNANCLQLSARHGEPSVVTGDLDTLMAGLSCGEVSLLAWEILHTGADDFLTVDEESVPKTMRLLASGFQGDPQIEAGESAVAGLAALICARNQSQLSAALGLDQSSRVYLLGTEGATDPELYQRLVAKAD